MDGQRQKPNGSRRRRKRSNTDSKPQTGPVLIAARRPDSPLLSKVPQRNIAASARPKKPTSQTTNESMAPARPLAAPPAERPRRVARIVQARTVVLDEAETRRQRLLERLTHSEGRSAISRLADELLQGGGVPEQQEYQLQLLEHVNEQIAKAAMSVLARLFEKQTPIKRPILDQRLRRLQDEADEADVRETAEELRRTLRLAYPMTSAEVF
jgi:hypothetical protein